MRVRLGGHMACGSSIDDSRGGPTGPLSVWDRRALSHAFATEGIKLCHLNTLYRALLAREHTGQNEFAGDEWANWLDSLVDLPAKGRELLATCALTTSTVTAAVDGHGQDGKTTKLVLRRRDGQLFESVLIRHAGHTTLCVSSQIGCKMGCKFCATGTMGLRGQLTSGEIMEQLVHANRLEWPNDKVRNVVFMGMGEPLDNYDNVLAALHFMTDSSLFSLSQRRVTLSTVGVPALHKLIQDAPFVSLALSLHAPNQELRAQVVPSARAFPLDRLMSAVDAYLAVSKNQLLVEYILIKDVNDQHEHAHQLGRLLQHRRATVNLIPYNPTDVPYNYAAPDDSRRSSFFKILRTNYGIYTTLRKHQGRDADAACGQLALRTSGQQQQQQGWAGSGDIEDLIKASVSHKAQTTGQKHAARTSNTTISSTNASGASKKKIASQAKKQQSEQTKKQQSEQTDTPNRTARHGQSERLILWALFIFFLLLTLRYSVLVARKADCAPYFLTHPFKLAAQQKS
eukprot:g43287.t1